MEFKIDTKETFSTITPLNGTISAILTGAIGEKCGNLRQSGSKNFIVDLQHCTEIEENGGEALVAMHEEFYGNEESLVFTGVSGKVLASLKKNETDLLINIAPSMIEAVDIVSMEILERDLFNEE